MGARTYTGPNSFYFFEKFLLDELTRLNISPSWGQKPFSDSGRTAPPVLSNTRRMFPCFKSTLTATILILFSGCYIIKCLSATCLLATPLKIKTT